MNTDRTLGNDLAAHDIWETHESHSGPKPNLCIGDTARMFLRAHSWRRDSVEPPLPGRHLRGTQSQKEGVERNSHRSVFTARGCWQMRQRCELKFPGVHGHGGDSAS